MSTLETAPPAQASTPPEFAAEVMRMIAPFQASLRRMLAQWGSPPTASDLDRLSGAGAKICWQIFRIVNAEDVVTEARNAPSPTYLRRMLAAAAEAGVPGETIRSVEESARAFQSFSKHVASDRDAFHSMLAGASSEENSGKIDVSQRRAAYRAMSHIGGVQTDLLYFSAIIRRSADGNGTDGALLLAQRGLRRLRPEAQVTLFSYHRNPSQAPGDVQNEDAMDPAAARRYGVPVLPQFSSQPLPAIERLSLPSGYELYNVAGTDVGPRASFDCTFGRFRRNGPFMTDVDNRRLYHMTYAHVRKPVALGIQELIIHRPSFPNAQPELMVFKYIEGDVTQEGARRSQQYPVEERLTHVGRADAVGLGEVPRYNEMLRYGANAAGGWDLGEFDVYRVRMPFPILLSAVRIFFYVD
jgi:hypothetical protein